MREDSFFIGQEGQRLFSTLHRPAQPAAIGFVMCHPLGEEKLWSHRVFVSFARMAATAGAAVLRFDFRGEGDSDWEFEHSDLESRINDACRAVDTLRERCGATTEVVLIGLRLGASIAAEVAARRDDISQAILWNPIVDGAIYMQSLLRLNLMYQMAVHRRVVEDRDALLDRLHRGDTVNVEGYEIAEAIYSQVSRFKLANVLQAYRGDIVVVQVVPPETNVAPEIASVGGSFSRCRIHSVQGEPFWREVKSYCQHSPELSSLSLREAGIVV